MAEAGWAAAPGAVSLATFTLEGCGWFVPRADAEPAIKEDGALWSVFKQCGELMRWSRGFRHSGRGLPDTGLWWLEEAEFTPTDAPRIGFAQVGVERDSQVAPLVAPLIRCYADSLARFGHADLRALQFRASNVLPGGRTRDQRYGPPFALFRLAEGPRAEAFISFDDTLVHAADEREFIANIQSWNGLGIFEFGSLAAVPPGCAVVDEHTRPPETQLLPAPLGIPILLPEWTPDSAAAAMGWVIENARNNGRGGPNFAIRITRTD